MRASSQRVRVPDLDFMPLDRLEKMMGRLRGLRTMEIARLLFPSEPLQYMIAAKMFYRMGLVRIKFLQTSAVYKRDKYSRQYEAYYGRLPVWARWRDRLNVAAAVVPGKKFRRNPPKPKI